MLRVSGLCSIFAIQDTSLYQKVETLGCAKKMVTGMESHHNVNVSHYLIVNQHLSFCFLFELWRCLTNRDEELFYRIT